jgi:hypothetical protein
MFGSIAIAPLIIPCIFAHAVDTPEVMIPPRK